MTMALLIDKLATEKFGNVIQISDRNQSELEKILSQTNNFSNVNPVQFYNDWFRGKNSVLERVSKSLLSDYPIKLISGNKVQNIFLSSLLSFDIEDYISSKGYKIDFKDYILLDYNDDLYEKLTFVTIAMLINKYDVETIYYEHILFICIKVMVTYFKMFEGRSFLCDLSKIEMMVEKALYTEVDKYYSFAENNGFRYNLNMNYQTNRKSLSKEQIFEFITPEDSQKTIKEKIMKWCPCGDRKARNIMKRYGLTLSRYERKDYKQRHNDIKQKQNEMEMIENVLGDIV